jgi:hypothetical protein
VPSRLAARLTSRRSAAADLEKRGVPFNSRSTRAGAGHHWCALETPAGNAAPFLVARWQPTLPCQSIWRYLHFLDYDLLSAAIAWIRASDTS